MTTSFSMRYGTDSFTVKSKGFNEMVTLVHLEAVPEEGEVADLGHWPPECTLNQMTAVKTTFHCANRPAYVRIRTQRILSSALLMSVPISQNIRLSLDPDKLLTCSLILGKKSSVLIMKRAPSVGFQTKNTVTIINPGRLLAPRAIWLQEH